MKKYILFAAVATLLSQQASAQKYRAVITTTYGDIELVLYDSTPKHRDNFIKLAKAHFYDGLLFHRVIPGFMIQGGDPDSKEAKPDQLLGNGDVGYTVPAEFVESYYHKRGALAAARDGNPAKASSGCQFYIVVGKKFQAQQLEEFEARSGKKYTEAQKKMYETAGGTPHLDRNYTVYGEVTKGMDIVDKIVNSPKNAQDRPNEDQRILKVKIRKKGLF